MPSRYRRRLRPMALPATRLAEFGSDPMAEPGKRRPRPRVVAAPEPMTPEALELAASWIAARVIEDPRRRIPVAVLVRTWRDHATALAIKPGPRAELVRLILAAHPSASVRARINGRDPSMGDHQHGIALQ